MKEKDMADEQICQILNITEEKLKELIEEQIINIKYLIKYNNIKSMNSYPNKLFLV